MSIQDQSETEFETPDGVGELYRGGTVLGIPSDHFGGALLFSSLFAASLSWVVGLAFGFGLMSMLYFIHQDDKQALDIWRDRLRSRWGAWRLRRGVTRVILRISRDLGTDFTRSWALVSRDRGQPFREVGQAD